MTSRIVPVVWLAIICGCSTLEPTRAAPAPPPRDQIENGPPAPPGSSLVLRDRQLGVMGTDLKITVIGRDPEDLELALDAAVTEIRRVEDLMTDWRASPLETLNAAAGLGPQSVPPELARLVARSQEISELTGGAFDITFGAVGKLWKFKGVTPALPLEAEISAALRFVDFRRIVVDLENATVELPAGFRIGLGGIAKGYGVDRAMEVLLAHGIRHAIVNAGGDMKVLGTYFGEPWEIAIQHPRRRGIALAALRMSNACIVTSGDYERFFEIDGRRYHHILDPRTGFPATGAMSVTVVAPDAAFADALATALCVMGPEQGLPLIEQLPRVEALVVDLTGETHASSGLQGFFAE